MSIFLWSINKGHFAWTKNCTPQTSHRFWHFYVIKKNSPFKKSSFQPIINQFALLKTDLTQWHFYCLLNLSIKNKNRPGRLRINVGLMTSFDRAGFLQEVSAKVFKSVCDTIHYHRKAESLGEQRSGSRKTVT